MSSRMRRQVDQLLDVAQLQLGRSLHLSKRKTDLAEVARTACTEYHDIAEQHRIIFRTEAEHVVGLWDTVRVERVLDNLLGNAVKYSPSGGEITVTVGSELGGPAHWGVLSVRDQGIGIPAEDVPHVFERFYRAKNVHERMIGTGIGLASTRQIVEEHGGSILAESEPGRGSTFVVRLPLEVPDDDTTV